MEKRKQLIEFDNKKISVKQQCHLLGVPRGSMYYKEKPQKNNDCMILQHLRDIYERKPFFGYRKMTVELRAMGIVINHKRVQRLMQIAGIKAIYPTKKTSVKNPTHKIFPYLLHGIKIDRPNQVWQVDITYIGIKGGFIYLTALIDVFSRKIMGWNVSTFLDTVSCLEALNNAFKHGIPEIVNSDQGCQFTSHDWISTLQQHGVLISMDGRGRWADNIFCERLWRTIKYEAVYLCSFDTVDQAKAGIGDFITFYNEKRFHQSLNYHTPSAVFEMKRIPTKQELFDSFSNQNACAHEVSMF